MGKPDDHEQAPLLPSRQLPASSTPAEPAASDGGTLEQARKFLHDETVKDASRENKAEFLKSKGLHDADIARLLEQSTAKGRAAQSAPTQPTTTTPPTADTPASPPQASSSTTQPDRAPIVTYPEFLTAPRKPPPLITAAGLLNSLTAIAAASTLVYGATKHLVQPMITALTAARVDLHATATADLAALVTQLERAVSELPAGYHQPLPAGSKKPPGPGPAGDDASSVASSAYDDPSEVFHRDVGVQTSAPPSPLPAYLHPVPSTSTATARTPADSQTGHQATRLTHMAAGVRALDAGLVHHTEELAATTAELQALGADLHKLTYPPEPFAVGPYLYGSEPNDEIRRVKMSIRGVKGVLLSTRSFPATTR